MSDEQTRLLQEILEVAKEQLAFEKQRRDELMALQRTAIAGKKRAFGWRDFSWHS